MSYLCGGLRPPLLTLDFCSHQLCLPCVLYFIRYVWHSPRISEVSDLEKGFGTLTCLQAFCLSSAPGEATVI